MASARCSAAVEVTCAVPTLARLGGEARCSAQAEVNRAVLVAQNGAAQCSDAAEVTRAVLEWPSQVKR